MGNIIVYQMGKVGSISVQKSLLNEGINVQRVHDLNNIKNPSNNDKYIIPVREPVGRNLSAFFQNIDKFYPEYYKLEVNETQKLVNIFLEKYPSDHCLRWFDNNVKNKLGVDIYKIKFNPKTGYQIYDNILVFRIEDFNKKGELFIKKFLGVSINPMHINKTTPSRMKIAPYYLWAKSKSTIPKNYINSMYSSKFTKYFYNSYELNKYRNYWLRQD